MVNTVKNHIDEQEGEEALILRDALHEASRLSNGADFSQVQVGSVSEMGDAAGDFHIFSERVRVREDVLNVLEDDGAWLTHVLVHEQRHKSGDHMEGFTELFTVEKTGDQPVDAYREQVRHAKAIVDVIGSEAMDMAKEENAKELLFDAYVHEAANNGIHFERAAKEVAEHLEKAA